MTITEAKQAQAALDAALAEALNAFSAKTGLTVTNLQLDRFTNLGAQTTYQVWTEVRP